MKKIFIINGGQTFAHSGGSFNNTLTKWTKETLDKNGFEVRVTYTNNEFEPMGEVENFKWADMIIYHTPIWWFQVPNRLKKYIDEVFTAGHQNGIYANDGRSRKNPEINYGTGGLMHGKKYMVNTTWNAPETAFTLEGEFFDQKSVDEGVLFGFHKMNQFAGLERINGFHFHDLEKNATPERIENYRIEYTKHLENAIITEEELVWFTPTASEKGATVSQLVLRWTSLQPAISVVLAGARNAEQAVANAKAMDIAISAEEMNFIKTELAKI